MILAVAVVAGFMAGLLRAAWAQAGWKAPELRYAWLALVFFLPQFVAFNLPGTRAWLPAWLAPVCLVISMMGLALFCLLNRRLPGMLILTTGLLLNLAAILANGGLMPLGTNTAGRLLPPQSLAAQPIGERFGTSKDILLAPEHIALPWLADRFTPPGAFPYQFAFSLGDVFIAAGAFILLALSSNSGSTLPERQSIPC